VAHREILLQRKAHSLSVNLGHGSRGQFADDLIDHAMVPSFQLLSEYQQSVDPQE
jgi:hypothetical protein